MSDPTSTIAGMDIDTFWTLIQDSLDHSPKRSARQGYLHTRLIGFEPEEIAEFQSYIYYACARADSWDLWQAAARICGGFCSDDGFEYFRLWLVGRGRDVFERAIAVPDSLAEAPEIQRLVGRPMKEWDDDAEFPAWESLAYVAGGAYAEVTAEEDEDAFDDAVDAVDLPAPLPDYLAEQRWNARDEQAATVKIPNLARAFPTNDY
jgi:Protein of unknown function (DUF4240)